MHEARAQESLTREHLARSRGYRHGDEQAHNARLSLMLRAAGNLGLAPTSEGGMVLLSNISSCLGHRSETVALAATEALRHQPHAEAEMGLCAVLETPRGIHSDSQHISSLQSLAGWKVRLAPPVPPSCPVAAWLSLEVFTPSIIHTWRYSHPRSSCCRHAAPPTSLLLSPAHPSISAADPYPKTRPLTSARRSSQETPTHPCCEPCSRPPHARIRSVCAPARADATRTSSILGCT